VADQSVSVPVTSVTLKGEMGRIQLFWRISVIMHHFDLRYCGNRFEGRC